DLMVRDPAEWELIFANAGYHLLDQRPIHLASLPLPLLSYMLKVYAGQFRSPAGPPDRIAPRQGPFYFWVLVPRKKSAGRARAGDTHSPTKQGLWQYDKAETIEVCGNIGSHVYRAIDGVANLVISDRFNLPFAKGFLFGQMELSQNNFSSRILGPLTASEATVLDAHRIFELKARLQSRAKQGDFGNELFLSMIAHLDEISFLPFINAKPDSRDSSLRPTDASEVVRTGVKSRVRNYAAVILNSCARQSQLNGSAYKARLLIRLPYRAVQDHVYHEPKRQNTDEPLMNTLLLLIQNNIVDCFSARLVNAFVEQGGIQQSVEDKPSEELENGDYFHLGLIAALHVRRALGGNSANFDLETVAIGISGVLGNILDLNRYRSRLSEEAAVELRATGKRVSVPLAPTPKHLIAWLERTAGPFPADLSDRISRYITRLRMEFGYRDREHYQRKGYSNYIV